MITPQNEGKNVVVKKIKVRPNVNIIYLWEIFGQKKLTLYSADYIPISTSIWFEWLNCCLLFENTGHTFDNIYNVFSALSQAWRALSSPTSVKLQDTALPFLSTCGRRITSFPPWNKTREGSCLDSGDADTLYLQSKAIWDNMFTILLSSSWQHKSPSVEDRFFKMIEFKKQKK